MKQVYLMVKPIAGVMLILIVIVGVISCEQKPAGKPVNQPETASLPVSPTNTADVKIDKPEVVILTDAPEEVRLGQDITYTLTIANKGESIAKEVVIRNYIPAGLRYKDKIDGVTLKWNLNDLLPGENRKIVNTVTAIAIGAFNSKAEVYFQGKITYQTLLKTRVVAPDLKITVEGPRECYLYRSVSYIITIVNNGGASAKDIEIIDTIPKFLDYIDSTPGGIFTPAADNKLATISWQREDILPNAKEVITLTLRAKARGRCANSVKLFSRSHEAPAIAPLEAATDLQILGIPAMHISTYDTEDPVEIGRQTIYVIETRNEGTAPCTNIRIESKIPEEMEFVSATADVPFKNNGNTIIFEAVPILPPGDKLVYKVIGKAIKEGSAKHTATLTYDQFEKPIIDEEGTSLYK